MNETKKSDLSRSIELHPLPAHGLGKDMLAEEIPHHGFEELKQLVQHLELVFVGHLEGVKGDDTVLLSALGGVGGEHYGNGAGLPVFPLAERRSLFHFARFLQQLVLHRHHDVGDVDVTQSHKSVG